MFKAFEKKYNDKELEAIIADNKNALEFYKHIGMHIQKIGIETILK